MRVMSGVQAVTVPLSCSTVPFVDCHEVMNKEQMESEHVLHEATAVAVQAGVRNIIGATD